MMEKDALPLKGCEVKISSNNGIASIPPPYPSGTFGTVSEQLMKQQGWLLEAPESFELPAISSS